MTELTSLFDSAAAGGIGFLTRELEAKPELAQATNEHEISLLMWAMYNRQADIAKLVYRYLDEPSAAEAVAVNDLDRLKAILASAPELIANYSDDGFTLLHYACFFANTDGVNLLLKQGAEVNCAAQNPSKVFPIHSAVAAQATHIVALLLAAGAKPDVQQTGGYTPLMSAAAHNKLELIELLLGNGADKSVSDDEGKTAYDHGVEKGFVIKTLMPPQNQSPK